MEASALECVLAVLDGFQAKDVEAVVGRFAAQGVFADPHYPPPVGPAMVGHSLIRQGLTWALGMLEQPGFMVRHELWNPERPLVAAVEVDTNHRMMGGATVAFPQVFVAEVGDDGLLRRLQSYAPYPPPAG